MLGIALRAALEQTGVSLEVVVVDDASAASPPADVERLLRDDRVAVVRLPERRGAAAAANAGARRAAGDWIAFLRDRDLWAPYHLATLLEVCERGGAEFAYSAAWLVDGDRRICGFRPAPAPDVLARSLLEENVLGSSSVAFRQELFRRAGGLDEWLNELAEWDLWIRWSRVARAAMVPTATVASMSVDGRVPAAEIARELRELKRRYGGDAKRAGVRFGRGASAPAAAGGDAPSLDALPPWLERESPTETV